MRWNVASRIVIAWVVTLPAAAVIGALFYLLTVHLSVWFLTSDTPSFAGGLMLARLKVTRN